MHIKLLKWVKNKNPAVNIEISEDDFFGATMSASYTAIYHTYYKKNYPDCGHYLNFEGTQPSEN